MAGATDDVFTRIREGLDDASNAIDAGLTDAGLDAIKRVTGHLPEVERLAATNGAPGNGGAAHLRAVPQPAQPATPEPAQNLEAEESVIGALLMNAPAAVKKAAAEVTASDFYRESHGIIFDAAVELDAQGSPADFVTVTSLLERKGLLARAGGKDRLRELAGLVPPTANVAHYARIVRHCALQRNLTYAVAASPQNLEAISEAAAALTRDTVASSGQRARDGAEWISTQPEGCPSLWGRGDQVLWAEGEPLMIYGPDGVGKTTLAQQVVLHMCGIRADTLLSFHVERQQRPVLYLACDRPKQARRSFYRMVPPDRHGDLSGRLLVWEGPLPFAIPAQPRALLDFALLHEAGVVVIDSLKDVAVDLTKPEVALRCSQAFQWLVANGVEVLILHHPRKDPAGQPSKPKELEDVYGDRNFVSGMGSVISLWGKAGDPVVLLEHLKQPAGEAGPFKVLHDHDRGITDLFEFRSMETIIGESPRPLTVPEVASIFYGKPEPTRNEIEKTRRELRKLTEAGVAIEMKDTATGTLSFAPR